MNLYMSKINLPADFHCEDPAKWGDLLPPYDLCRNAYDKLPIVAGTKQLTPNGHGSDDLEIYSGTFYFRSIHVFIMSPFFQEDFLGSID